MNKVAGCLSVTEAHQRGHTSAVWRQSSTAVRFFTERKLVKISCFIVVVIAAATMSGLAALDPAAHTNLSQTFMKLPLVFEAQDGQPESETQFTARSSGYALSFTRTEVVMLFAQTYQIQQVQTLRGVRCGSAFRR